MDAQGENPPQPVPLAPIPYARLAGFDSPQTWHALGEFSPVMAAVCHIITFGLFTLIHFQSMHDRLPKTRADDPSAARAIWMMFIPFYNFYWMFFIQLRLLERIDTQRQLAGLPNRPLRGLCIAMLVMLLIPYVNVISFFIVHPVYVKMLQENINELSRA